MPFVSLFNIILCRRRGRGREPLSDGLHSCYVSRTGEELWQSVYLCFQHVLFDPGKELMAFNLVVAGSGSSVASSTTVVLFLQRWTTVI